MQLNEPRIPALEPEQWNEAAQEIMKPFVEIGQVSNIFKTLTNHPDLMSSWLTFGTHILGTTTLEPRERQLLILRTGYRCKSAYEWGQHVAVARHVGMSDDDIRLAKADSDSPGLSDFDRLLLKAADELHDDVVVSEETWQGLSKHLSTQQLLDLLFTVGQYTMVSMMLNSTGVQNEEGLPGWDI